MKIFAVLLAAMTLAGAAHAQLPTTVNGKLAFMAEGLDQVPLVRTPKTGRLKEGEKAVITLPITAHDYLVVLGACAQTCTRLDMEVWDDKERFIGQRTNDYADAIQTVDSTKGDFRSITVHVTMHTCPGGKTCQWGVNIYGYRRALTETAAPRPGPTPAPSPTPSRTPTPRP